MAAEYPNYIRHLNAFISISRNDRRLTGNHISLYVALFITWNENFFPQFLKINRASLLDISHIGSCHTYRKCMRDLEKSGYIRYWKSETKGKASEVTLIPMREIKEGKNASLAGADLPVNGSKNASPAGANMHPFKNNINSLNKERDTTRLPEKGKPENLEEVVAFFHLHGQAESEAALFFHHYDANGWKQGGKVPLEKWTGAARKWILNINPTQTFKNGRRKQGTGAHTGNLHTNQNKSYSDPL